MKKSSVCAVFGDVQIHAYKQHNTDGKRLRNCLNAVRDVYAYCAANKIKTIFFVGDLYDTMKVLLSEVVNETVKLFMELANQYPEIVCYAISGNHDHGTKNTPEYPAVTSLSHIEMVAPYNFILLDNKVAAITPDVAVAGVPYYEHKEHFSKHEAGVRELLSSNFAPQTKCYLLMHQTPRGIVAPNGISADFMPFDMSPEDEQYRNFYAYTFCGHIHTSQFLTSNFLVVGNLLHRDSSDAGKKKGFYTFDLYHPEDTMQFHYLSNYPEFVVCESADSVPEGSYAIIQPDFSKLSAKMSSGAGVEEFSSGLPAAEILENYWKAVDGKDAELLQVGLTLLP